MPHRLNMLHDQLRRVADELEMAGTAALTVGRFDLATALAELAESVDNLRRIEFPQDSMLA